MTADELITLIKAASNKMRADDNTKSTPKYLEHFSWLLFLKVFEQVDNEASLVAEIDGHSYQPVIRSPYCWSEWTRKKVTGDELVHFVTDDLFPHLRSLSGRPEARKVAEIFNGVTTVMKSGYVLAEVIDIVAKVDFHDTDEFHAMSVVYESLLAEMGSDAGWSGEHYTPRPIIEFIVAVVDPHVRETVYDPCSGSCGFLVAALTHLLQHVSTVDDHERLQRGTLFGQESGELPYLLGTMNLLLHGARSPDVIRTNSLEQDIRSIAPSDQHDVVLTNPPFGGSEHPQVQQNFPIKSSSTQLLFMQHILAKLKKDGRLGVVLPESFLSNGGVFETFRQQLLRDWNVHTIVGMPAKGIWYKDVKTVLLFADGGGPTSEILFVEVSPPEGQKNFTKRKPLTRERLAPYLQIVRERVEGDKSWIVSVKAIEARGWDMRPLRPLADPALSVADAAQRIQAITPDVDEITRRAEALRAILQETAAKGSLEWVQVPLGKAMALNKDRITIDDAQEYRRVRVALHGRGLFLRDVVHGSEIKTKTQYLVRTDQLLVAEIDAKVGGMGLVPQELDGAIVSSHYFAFDIDENQCTLGWMDLLCRAGHFVRLIAAKGATNYASVRPDDVLGWEIPLPDRAVQEALVGVGDDARAMNDAAQRLAADTEAILADIRLAGVAGLVPTPAVIRAR